MDGFITYNVPRKPRPNLMMPPPYLKRCDKEDAGKMEDTLKIHYTNPAKLLLLCESLTDSTSRGLERKINGFLRKETSARCVFMISFIQKEAYVHVVGDKILSQCLSFPVCGSVVETVLQRRAALDAKVAQLPDELVHIMESILEQEEESKTLVVVPVFPKSLKGRKEHEPVVLLVCLVNCPLDIIKAHDIIKEAFRFCLPILFNTKSSEEESRLKTQSQALLDVARRLFNHLGDLNDLLKEIMSVAKALTDAERCSLFLLDNNTRELVAKVFDGQPSTQDVPEVRIAKDQGIAGHVVMTGKLLNIGNAYEHPLFYQGMDEATGFKTRNILCFPIRDEKGVVGVAQLCNKRGNLAFDRFDEEAASAFSIYCGISIMHSLVYKQIKEAQTKSQLSNDLMLYHMKPKAADITHLQQAPLTHADLPDNFTLFQFNPRVILVDDMARYVLFMLDDLNLINTFKLNRANLARFVLYVRRGYRDTPYHNWTHAFTVTHFSYLLVKRLDLLGKKILTDLDALGFLISCLCHDIDHRGTTNAFQLKANNELASLYSSEGSVMERHHVSQALAILNTPGCNFLESIDNSDYGKFIMLLNENILATDLAKHIQCLPKQQELVQHFHRHNTEHKRLFMSLMMTCCDLSDQTKGWAVAWRVAQLIFEEFFRQGDLEREIGEEPMEMMDRDKASIPVLQIQFLEDVCLAPFQILAAMYPAETSILVDVINSNISSWTASREVFEVMDSTSLRTLIFGTNLERDIRDKIVGATGSSLFSPGAAKDAAKSSAPTDQ